MSYAYAYKYERGSILNNHFHKLPGDYRPSYMDLLHLQIYSEDARAMPPLISYHLNMVSA